MNFDTFFECTFNALIVENIGWPGILFNYQFSDDFQGSQKKTNWWRENFKVC